MTKGDVGWRQRDKMQHDNLPANKRQPGGEVDKRWLSVARRRLHVERTIGGGSMTTEAMHNNQPENKRQTGGKASADRVRWSIKRTRGSSCATRSIAATSKKTRGKGRICTSYLESWWCLKTKRAAAMLVDTCKGEDMMVKVVMKW